MFRDKQIRVRSSAMDDVTSGPGSLMKVLPSNEAKDQDCSRQGGFWGDLPGRGTTGRRWANRLSDA